VEGKIPLSFPFISELLPGVILPIEIKNRFAIDIFAPLDGSEVFILAIIIARYDYPHSASRSHLVAVVGPMLGVIRLYLQIDITDSLAAGTGCAADCNR
jgi:hypothetical protein